MPSTDLKTRYKKRKLSAVGSSNSSAGYCSYCKRDLSKELCVKCLGCHKLVLCLDCFRVGAEIASHKRNHEYQLLGDLSTPIFAPNWRVGRVKQSSTCDDERLVFAISLEKLRTQAGFQKLAADEEILILEALDMYGLGSWLAVSNHVTTKTATECKQHYMEVYARSSDAPLPSIPLNIHDRDGKQVHTQEHVPTSQERAKEQSMGQDAEIEPEASKVYREETPDIHPAVSVGALRPGGVDDFAQVDVGSASADTAAGTEHLSQGKQIDMVASPGKKLRADIEVGSKADDSSNEKETGDKAQQQQQQSARGLPSARLPAYHVSLKLPPGIQGKTNFSRVGSKTYEMTGFHSKRSEFEHEYDNNAELLIADLEILPSDTSDEKEKKLNLLNIYNARLRERERRREAVICQRLLHVRPHQVEEKVYGTESGMRAEARSLARFTSLIDHQKLVDSFLLEKFLRSRLKARSESRNIPREDVQSSLFARRCQLLFSAHSISPIILQQPAPKFSALQELKELRGSGVRCFADAKWYEAEQQGQGAQIFSGLTRAAVAREEKRPKSKGAYTATSSGLQNTTSGALLLGKHVAWPGCKDLNLDLTGLPAANLLTQKERKLCATNRLLPSQYLAYKATFLRVTLRQPGLLSGSDAGLLLHFNSKTAWRADAVLAAAGRAKDYEFGGNDESAVHRVDELQNSAPGSPLYIGTIASSAGDQ